MVLFVPINTAQIFTNYSTQSVVHLIRLISFTYIIDWIKLTYIYEGINKNLENELSKENKDFFLITFSRKISSYFYVIAFFIMITHINACIFLYIGQELTLTTDRTWIKTNNFEEYSLIEKYLTSLYFIFVTILTVGYGDITPQSTTEHIYNILLLLIECFLYSYIIILGTVVLGDKDKKTKIIEERKKILEKLRKDYQLNQNLVSKINRCIVTRNYLNWNNSLSDFLETLPNLIKNELSIKMYNQTIESLIFFKDKSDNFILLSVPLIKSFTYLKDDILWSVGEKITEMILIYEGKLVLKLGNEFENAPLCFFDQKSHYGEVNMFDNDSISNYNLICKALINKLFTLSQDDFLTIKYEYPKEINETLFESIRLHKLIEKKRILMIDHYLKYLSFNNFNLYNHDVDSQTDSQGSSLNKSNQNNNAIVLQEIKEDNSYENEDNSQNNSNNNIIDNLFSNILEEKNKEEMENKFKFIKDYKDNDEDNEYLENEYFQDNKEQRKIKKLLKVKIENSESIKGTPVQKKLSRRNRRSTLRNEIAKENNSELRNTMEKIEFIRSKVNRS